MHCFPVQADIKQCTAEGEGLQRATKYQVSCFVLHVRNEFGSPCTCDQIVHAELRHCHTATMPQVKVDVKLLDTPGDYEVTYTPQCTGDHELNVFVNGQVINGSPFKIFVDNLPDPQHCTASGPGIESMKKDKNNSVYFQIKLADSDNEQCVLPQAVPVIISVNIRAKHSGKQVQVTVVPESASDYRVSYTPAVAGEMEVSVMVSRVHINNSPWKVRVDNLPDLRKSRTSFSDIHTIKKSKTKTVTADVYLMDSYNEPCVFEQKVSVVIMRRPSPMAQSTMETICTNIICKSPSHYQVCFIPDRAGKWMVQVKINRMLAFGSPLQITIKNCPSIEHCKVYDVPKQFVKGDECALKLRLADSDGEDCVFPQHVTASVLTLGSETSVEANIITLSSHQYEISFTPFKTGSHTVQFQVEHIGEYCHKVSVVNEPDLQHCTASGPGLSLVKKDKSKPVSFHVRLADLDNEPCVSPQNVAVTLTMREIRKQIPQTVVQESTSVYHVSYTPAVAGEMEVSVMVNGVHIKNSPWTVRVDNPPDLSKSRTSFSDVHTFKKSKTKTVTADVYLMDSYNEPCVFEQKVSVVIMRSRPSSMAQSTKETICTDIICKSPSHYQVCFTPDRAGEWMVQVKINGIRAFGSSLMLTIDNPPSIEHCELYDIPKKILKGEMCVLKVRLADSDGEDCVTPQHVTASVTIPGSETSVEAKVITLSSHQYQMSFIPFKTGSHTVQFQIEHIGECCHKVSVVNEPDHQHCTASGPGLEVVKMDKSKPVSFLVRLADSDNEPCVSPQNVSVNLTMRETGKQIPQTVVPESASDYRVSYTPAVAGEMEVSVMVKGVHIKNSPWIVRVDNPPDLSKSRTSFSDVHTLKKSKTKIVTADVYLMDSYNEPCVFEQKVSAVIMRSRPSSMAQSTMETICTDIVCKSPSHYQVCFIPDRAGKWMVQVKINGMLAFGSPLLLTIDNPPSFEHYKVYDVPKQFVKGDECALKLRLADSDGEDCVFPQHVTVSVLTPGSETLVEANIITLSSHQYQISFIPFKTGSHTVQFEVEHIGECSYKVSVVNEPDLQHCTASGPGLSLVKIDKSKPVSFHVRLADSDNEPCVSPQNVAVTLTMREIGKQIPQTVVQESTSDYHVSYTPAVAGEMEVSVMVNGVHIKNSPWMVRVDNPPDLSKSRTSFVHNIKKRKTQTVTADVYLMDSYNEPCVSEQCVSVVIMGRRTSPMAPPKMETIRTNIVCKSPSHYRISFIPDRAGEWRVWVNGIPFFGSPFQIIVHNLPSLEHCRVYVPKKILKGEMCEIKLRLADSDGEDCVFPQPVTASVSIPGSETSVEAKIITLSSHQYMSFIPFKAGSHTVQFQVKHIGEYCHKVSVVNEPDLQHCTASGPGLKLVKKDKSKPVSFHVSLADSDNEPCVSPQNVAVTLTMRETGKQIPTKYNTESASIYRVSYTPAVAGEMEVSVMVNRVHIKNSPWTVRVDNPPDLSKSRTSFSDVHTFKKSKTKTVTADVYLMDSYNEPCVFEQKVSVVIMRSRPSSMAQSTMETICTDIVCKSPSHYQVCFIPDKAGEWTVWVKINGMLAFGSPLQITIKNCPSIEHCKVYDVPKKIVKGKMCVLKLRLADSDGEDCVFPQHVTASVSIPGSETSVEANIITLPSHQYQMSFTPFKAGSHTVQFQVKHIGNCSHKVSVVNEPDHQHCTASGPGLKLVKMDKSKPVSFLIKLADSDNEPCVSPQNVSVTLTMRETGEQIPVTVVPESASVYHVSYIPAVAGEMEVSVMVNGVHIKNSPLITKVEDVPWYKALFNV